MPRCPKLSYADDLIHVVPRPYTSFIAGSVAKKSPLGAKRTTGPYLLCSSCSVRVREHERSTDRFHFLVNLAMNGPWTDTGIGENSSPSLLVLLPYSRVIGALTATFHRTCVSSEESEEDWQWLAACLDGDQQCKLHAGPFHRMPKCTSSAGRYPGPGMRQGSTHAFAIRGFGRPETD